MKIYIDGPLKCNSIMGKRRYGTVRKRKPGVGRQHGGIGPLLAMAVPALLAGGKTTALGGIGAVANYGTKKNLTFLFQT